MITAIVIIVSATVGFVAGLLWFAMRSHDPLDLDEYYTFDDLTEAHLDEFEVRLADLMVKVHEIRIAIIERKEASRV